METPAMSGWNLAARFAVEVAALTAVGVAGWKLGAGGTRWALGVGLPVAAAVVWATFNVPGDPSRSGHAPIEVNGWTRLGVELVVLGGGAVAIWYAGPPALALAYVAVVVTQYATAFDRIGWLLEQYRARR